MLFMLDTNICIYAIKKKPQKVIDRVRALKMSDLGISSIVLSELECGVEKSSNPVQNRVALMQFLAGIDIAGYDVTAARHYGEIRTYLESNGQIIGAMDMLIAAHARSLGVILVTNNEKEFGRVPGLKIENWAL
ncbi:MAG: type II toxin-antitoxin system VapC family toxin [Proteobacteria bacterium]|nr:type II toxin-antitoxin system VapC family toxin [Pseudomonadota bacterium]